MRFREMRERAGIGMIEAAAHFGVTKQAVSAWELGLNRPNSETLAEMARYYDCSADELLGILGINETKEKT